MAANTPVSSRRSDETFRLQGIPGHLDRLGVQGFLEQLLDEDVQVRIHSLACDPEMPTEKIATLQFLTVPKLLLDDGTKGKDEWALSLPGELEGPVLDNHFRGMTPLHSADDATCTVDLIAVSGLGSHAFGSFKKRGEPYMWLRDSLSRDLRTLRIFIYGYDSNLEDSKSFQNINDLAIKFRNAMNNIRRLDSTRAVVLLGHSLGGLVVKQAIMQFSEQSEADPTQLDSVRGILLFGVPNQGMDIKSLVPMVGDQPNRYLLESLGPSSEVLHHQAQGFQKSFDSRKSTVFSFYETVESPTAQKVDDKWRMSGEPAVLVDRYSATHCRSWETGFHYVYPINRTHSEMVKFTSSQDEYYKVVRSRLQQLATRDDVTTPRRNQSVHISMGTSEQDCLRSFTFEMSNERLNHIIDAAENTCGWILSHQRYLEWNSNSHGILWIKGKPGSGKSTLMKRMLRDLKLKARTSRPLIASFFVFGQGSEMQKSKLGLYRSLLHQILLEVPTTLEYLFSRYSEACMNRGIHGKGWDWSEEEIIRFLRLTLGEAVKDRPVILLADALDELGEASALEAAEFLQELSDCFREDLKICFSCRHYPILSIEDQETICLEDENKQDIEAVIASKLKNVPQVEALNSLINDKADGVFQWAILVANGVRNQARTGRSFEVLQKSIEDLPTDLSHLYAGIMSNPERVTIRLLQWVCFAEKPIEPIALRQAMAVDADLEFQSLEEYERSFGYGDSDQDIDRMVKHISRGLAEVSKTKEGNTVRLIHQSVADFLRAGGLPYVDGCPGSDGCEQAHVQICRTCILYMGLKEIPVRMLLERKNANPTSTLYDAYRSVRSEFPLIEYASECWPIHAQHVQYSDDIHQCLLECFDLRDENHIEGPAIEARRKLRNADPDNFGSPLWYLRPMLASRRADWTLLHELTASGYRNALSLILATQKIHPDSTEQFNGTPLFLAAGNGNAEIVELLLSAGADVNFKSVETALHCAARCNYRKGAAGVKSLISAGANINAKSDRGATPLSVAASLGNLEFVREVLASPVVELDTETSFGMTPLLLAASNSYWDIVRLLVDARLRNNEQRNPESPEPMGRHSLKPYDFSGIEKVVLEEATNRLGAENDETVFVMEELSLEYWKRNELDSSERLQYNVVDILRKGGRRNPQRYLSSKSNLASIYWKKGRFEDAEQLDRQVLDEMRESSDTNDSDMIESMSRLAVTLKSQGKGAESEELEGKAEDLRSSVRSFSKTRHPSTWSSVSSGPGKTPV